MKYPSKIFISFLLIALTLCINLSFENVNAGLVTYSFTLNLGEQLDVDTGTAGTLASRDIWDTGTPASLLAQNGAVMAYVGSVDLNSVCDASQYTFDINGISVLNLIVGDVYLIQTNIGKYAKFRIDSVFGPIVGITVVYQDDGGTRFCDHAVGGILTPVNKFVVLAPYMALVGFVCAISAIFTIRKKSKN